MDTLSHPSLFDPNNPKIILEKTSWTAWLPREVLENINWEVLLSCFPRRLHSKVDIFIWMANLEWSWGITYIHSEDCSFRRIIKISNRKYLLTNPIKIIHTVCHELTHAFCQWKLKGNTGFSWDSNSAINTTPIDEWITELVADEVLHEYLRRMGHSRFISNRAWIDHTSINYRHYKLRAKQFIEKIASLAWISYSVAWEAIRTSYFESEDLVNVLSKDFWLSIDEIRQLTMNAWMLHEVKSLVRYIIHPRWKPSTPPSK
jgi:hypothetical protein